MPVLVPLFLFQLIIAVYALRNGFSWKWFWVILLIPFLGVLLFLFASNSSGNTRAGSRSHKNRLKKLVENLDESHSLHYRVELADKLISENMPFDAITVFHKSMLGEYRTNPDLLLGLAKAYFIVGKYSNARDALETLTAENPAFRSNEGHLLYALSLDRLDDFNGATREYTALIPFATNAEPRYYFSKMLIRTGQNKKAIEQLNLLIREFEVSASSSYDQECITRAQALLESLNDSQSIEKVKKTGPV